MGSSVACSPRILLCCFPGPFPERSGCPEPIRFPPLDPMTLFWEAQGGAEGDRPPGGLRAVARCLEPAAHEDLLVAGVGAGLVVHDAVLLAFVLDSREMKLVVFLVAGPTLPCLARFLLPLQWSHRHRRHVTAPPELLSRACRRLAWPGGSWPPSCGQPPAPEPVPSGWQRWKLCQFMSPCSETTAVALRVWLSAAVGHRGAAGCFSAVFQGNCCCFGDKHPGELGAITASVGRQRCGHLWHGAAGGEDVPGPRPCHAGTWRREPLISFQQQVGGTTDARALGEQPAGFSCSLF